MDSLFRIYLARAENELNLSKMIVAISENTGMQRDAFGMKPDTYYSAVITHAYYSIFYAAKAYLLIKGVKTQAPEEHRHTLESFSTFVEKGTLSMELLKIYKNVAIKADTLLHIFRIEKGKRGNFTYKRIPQANKEPAHESVENAAVFFKNMYGVCEI